VALGANPAAPPSLQGANGHAESLGELLFIEVVSHVGTPCSTEAWDAYQKDRHRGMTR
jgi:hypothetical protein